MVDHLSEDMVRAGWQFESEKDIDDRVNDKLDELGVQDKSQSMLEGDLIYGDGYTGIGLKENDLNIAESIEDPSQIQDIEFLTDYDHDDINDHITKRDLDSEQETQEDYNKIVKYNISGLTRRVHSDRMLHMQMRPRKGTDTGMSFFLDKQTLIQVFDNTIWSLGQILYQLVFKVVYTDLSGMSKEDIKKMRSRLETDLNVLTAFILDKGDESANKDELEFPSMSQGLGGVGDIIDFLEDVMSMGSKQPLSRLFGNQAGSVSGAEEDTRGYYDRIAGLQESYLKAKLRKVCRYILWSFDTDPDTFEWDIEFNDLWEFDEKTQAEIDLNRSKYYLNLWKMGGIGGSEVAEEEGFDGVDKSKPDNFDLPETGGEDEN